MLLSKNSDKHTVIEHEFNRGFRLPRLTPEQFAGLHMHPMHAARVFQRKIVRLRLLRALQVPTLDHKVVDHVLHNRDIAQR